MNPDLFLPVVRKCMEHLHEHGITRDDLIQRAGIHHFFGFGLWFRNHLMFVPDAPLRDLMWEPDETSGLFIDLIIKHWDSTEDEWRGILRRTDRPNYMSEYSRPSQLVICPDEDL